jgi:hypothetical protein|tara:strand:- start:54825 stop:54998 length:174 start_codon:yes stop_codon:yes gene_type:complete
LFVKTPSETDRAIGGVVGFRETTVDGADAHPTIQIRVVSVNGAVRAKPFELATDIKV